MIREILRNLSPLLLVVAVVLLSTRRRLIRQYRDARALDETSAIPPGPSSRLRAWWRARLLTAGVLRASEDGRHWLDETAWQKYRAARRRRVLVIFLCLAILMALLFVLNRLPN